MKKMSAVGTTVLMTAFAVQGVAQDLSAISEDPDKVDFLFSMAFTSGGDDLSKVEYENGIDGKVEAGGGLLFGLGARFNVFQNIEIRTTFNYYFDSEEAKNGNTEFTRMPIDVVAFYKMGNHRLGGGLTYHLNPEFEFKVDGQPSVNADYDNALGYVLEYDYFLSPGLAMGLRYTNIDYDVSSARVDGVSISQSIISNVSSDNGTNFGLFLHGFF